MTGQFTWASIAGAEPEPVEIIVRDGRKGILTCGCADPFWLDDESIDIRLSWNTMVRPATVLTEEERVIFQRRYEIRSAGSHGWRGSR